VITPSADERWSAFLMQWARTGSEVLRVLVDTPDSNKAGDLDAQAALLRNAGVRVYRRTSWAG
jgi:anti-sigma factor ChrR (cupin superfamily)